MIETRGASRAERRRIQKATTKGICATSRHGRIIAARDLELAPRASRPSVLEQGITSAQRPAAKRLFALAAAVGAVRR